MANFSKSYNASHHDRQFKTRSWPGRGQVDNRVDAYVDIAIQVFRRAEARGVDATLPAPATRTSSLKCNCTPYFLFCSQGPRLVPHLHSSRRRLPASRPGLGLVASCGATRCHLARNPHDGWMDRHFTFASIGQPWQLSSPEPSGGSSTTTSKKTQKSREEWPLCLARKPTKGNR
jgi:hypothetical protein